MEPIFKELTKLESLSVPSSSSSSSNKKSKTSSSSSSSSAPPLSVTLDSLIASLVKAQAKASSASVSQEELHSIWAGLEKEIGGSKEKIDEAIKTWHKAIGKVATAVEKALPPPIPIASPLYFTSPEATVALDRAVISALVRMGETSTVEALSRNLNTDSSTSPTHQPEKEIAKAQMLHSIISSMQAGDLQPALRWINQHGSHLTTSPTSTTPPSPLPFYLHRSIFITLLLSPSPTRTSSGIPPPILYAQTHFPPFTPHHLSTISRLLTATLYLPATKLASSPYADLLDEGLHQKLLIPMFEKEFCSWAGWPEKEVLGVAVGVGANGAVGRIEKGRKVMKERVGEGWKMGEELPMEIPLPPSLRYHSIFACPVSKILATPSNPPMMLVCGHAVAKESFAKLGKGIRTVKCPYCPVETPVASALELHF